MADAAELRRGVVATAQAMAGLGINQGTSGNVSARSGAAMLITPTATPYEDMTPEDVAEVTLADGAWRGPRAPSTEWRLHRDIFRARPEAGAVVHCHATYATALSIARRDIPACHYMIAAFGGGDVRCAPYATFGTARFSALAVAALDGRCACLLANHGMVVFGADLRRALWLAVELETLAKQYAASLGVGGPVLLTEAEVAEARAAFAGYGLRHD
jgi:L-fuculose-phosphate aldolase